MAGHSHALAFLYSMEDGHGPSGYEAAVVLDTERRSSSFLDDDYWRLLARAAAGRRIAVVWNGNQHNASFLLEASPAFRVYHDGAKASGSTLWVPRQVLREYWTPSFQELRDALPKLTAVAEVFILGTPPPKSDELIRSVIQKDEYFIQRATDLGMDLGALIVTDSETRIAMWSLLQDMLAECADEVGATFVPVPEDVMDSSGILLSRYAALDATHANPEYGARLWGELASAMSQKETTP